VIIVDAGGGTIDITAYVRKPNTTKPVYEEVAPAKCELLTTNQVVFAC
jgi:hypothetical protein